MTHSTAEFARALYLRGDPATQGLVHGRLLSHDIRQMTRTLREQLLPRVAPGSNWAKAASELFEHTSPEVVAEITAIAQGAGLPVDDVKLLNAFDDIWESVGCTTVVGWSPGEQAVWLAHNTDVGAGLPSTFQVVTRRETYGGRLSWVGPTWSGVAGTYVGLNEAGVAVIANLAELNEPPNARRGLPLKFAIRDALQRARSADEASGLLAAGRTTMGGVIVVADANGRAALVQRTPEGAEVSALQPRPAPYVFTNHFTSPKYASRQPPDLLIHSGQRHRAATSALAGLGPEPTVGELGELLGEAPLRLRAGEGPLTTVRSVLVFPARDALRMRPLPTAGVSGPFSEYRAQQSAVRPGLWIHPLVVPAKS